MPLAVGWVLALLAIAAFSALGSWQLQRMGYKQTLLDEVAAVLAQRTPVPMATAMDPARTGGHDWIELQGRFAAQPPLLLDNQLREGQAGVRVYRLFLLAQGGSVLVDMGWLSLQGRRVLPSAQVLGGSFLDQSLQVRGLLAPPPAVGLALGQAMGPQDGTWLLTRIDMDAIAALQGPAGTPLVPRVLKLDPDLPIGFERDLDILPNTVPPDRHMGYAVQWFGLALAVLVTALVLTLRSRRRTTPRHGKMDA